MSRFSSPALAATAALRVSPRLVAARCAGLQLRMAEEGGDDVGDLAKIPEEIPGELAQQDQLEDLTRGVEQLVAGFAMIQAGLGLSASAAAMDAQKRVGEGFSVASGTASAAAMEAQKSVESSINQEYSSG
ncbi:hypothetical protein T484DRAFT_1829750 [Baffinella frigidus]|nr:hypothetical protein T484DRAFT_1829750 [Cryptophyta sp. CCMP2293]